MFGACAPPALCLALGAPAAAETGYDLWLRYAALSDVARADASRRAAAIVGVDNPSKIVRTAIAELERGLAGLLSVKVPIVTRVAADGAIVIAVGARPPAIVSLGWTAPPAKLGNGVLRNPSAAAFPFVESRAPSRTVMSCLPS